MEENKNDLKVPAKASKNATAEKKVRKPREKYIPLAERFKDVPDVVWNEKCQTYLTERLATITANRNKTVNELSDKGLKLKRAEYDNLITRGLWEAKPMSDEFLLIAQKKSNLPGILRSYIESLLIEGMNHTIEHYREIEKERKTKKVKA